MQAVLFPTYPQQCWIATTSDRSMYKVSEVDVCIETKLTLVIGNLMYSPAIGDDYAIGRCTPMWDFIQQTNIILNFDAATMRKIERTSVNCGFSKYIDQVRHQLSFYARWTEANVLEQYLQFPPPKIQPPPELPIDMYVT